MSFPPRDRYFISESVQVTAEERRFIQVWMRHKPWCSCHVVVLEGRRMQPHPALIADNLLPHIGVGIACGLDWLRMWPRHVILATDNRIKAIRDAYECGDGPNETR